MQRLVRAGILVATLLAPLSAFAGSTVNPTVPAANSPLTSAPIRGNFAAAYNDINNILGMFAGPTAPGSPSVGQDWLDTGSTPAIWKKRYNTGWGTIGTFNLSTGAFSPSGTVTCASLPAFIGDVTKPSASCTLTIATVNSNVGSFGSSTAIPTFTVNAKGQITAAATAAVIAPAGTLTGGTLASNVLASSLTSVGALASGSLTTGFTPIANAQIANPSITVNGTLCTLGASCSVSATAASITVGTTTIVTGTPGRVLYDNAGVLGELATIGSGNVVLATSPTIASPTFSGTVAGAGTIPNTVLVNSSVTIGSTNIALGATATSISGLTLASPTFSGTVAGAGTIPNAVLVNASTTVNGQVCTLGSTCTISASAGSITVGTTTVTGGPGLLYNSTSGGNLAAVTGVNNAVLVTNGSAVPSLATTLPTSLTIPTATITTPTVTGGTVTAITSLGIRSTGAAFDMAIANTEVLTAGRTLTVTLNDAARTLNLGGNFTTAAAFTQAGAFGTTITSTAISNATLPAGTNTLASLNLAGQAVSGGATILPANLGTISSGTTTVNCGTVSLQYATNNGSFTLAAPAADSSCIIRFTNGASAVAITFSGWTVGANTGDAYVTTSGKIFDLFVRRINGGSSYSWSLIN